MTLDDYLDELETELERCARQFATCALTARAEGVRLALGKLRQARAAAELESAVRAQPAPACELCKGTREGRGSDGLLYPCRCTGKPWPTSGGS